MISLRNIFHRSVRSSNNIEDPSVPMTGNLISRLFFGGPSEKSHVTEQTSLGIGAVYACVRLLSNTIASIPLQIFDQKQNAKGQDVRNISKNNPLYPILHLSPNVNMSSFTWRGVMIMHLELWGNHYSYLARDSFGRVKEIRPLLPYHVQPFWDVTEVKYRYTPTGDIIAQADMIHIKGLSLNGLVGISTVAAARVSMGLSLDTDKFVANYYANNAEPGLVLSHPAHLSDDAQKNLKNSIDRNHTGANNAFRTMILEEGLKVDQIQIKLSDAQFIENRKFNRQDIASWFGIPPHMIGDLERSTNNNIEQQSSEAVMYAFRPRAVNIEQELNRKLLPGDLSSFIEFNLDGLLRGDTAARGDFYNKMILNGTFTRNEVRNKENYNPLDGLDTPLTPVNTMLTPKDGKQPVDTTKTNPDSEEEQVA